MSEALRLAGLLEVARDTLRGELGPLLPPDARYTAAMIANAMAVAARTMREGEMRAAQEADAIRELYGSGAGDQLDALRARLAADLRAGALDGPADHAVRVVLRARVAARLAISTAS